MSNNQNYNYDNNQPSPPPTKYCKFCGEIIYMDAVVCPKCGLQVEEFRGNPQQANQPHVIFNNTNPHHYGPLKSKVAAAILCFFFGYLGVHRFYTGKAGTGIIYLFTAGLCGIGVLIDFIVILVGGFRDNWGRPLE